MRSCSRWTTPAGRSPRPHAALIVHDGEILARDLHSTNGTVVTTGHRHVRLEPDREAPVPVGSIVELGSYAIRIELARFAG